MLYSFLMIGQSNMAGRGKLNEGAKVTVPGEGRLLMLRNGKWIGLHEPVNYDRPFSGKCLATTFAHDFALDHPDDKVGLIPAADGGSSLEDWKVGDELYENAINLARLAMRKSTIAGFLWHQGEAECGSDEKIRTYEERFLKIIESMKAELGLPDVPVIIGALGDYLARRTVSPGLINYPKVNRELLGIAERHEGYYFVSAKGLTSNPDYLHFNSESLAEFGSRYYRAFRDRVSLTDADFADFAELTPAWEGVETDDESAAINDRISRLTAKFNNGQITKEDYDREQKALMAML